MLGPGFYNMDCMEAMKEYPDKYFDLAIVDPPYGIGADNFKNGAGDKRFPNFEPTAVKAKKKNRLNQGGGTLRSRKLTNSDCSWDVAPTKEYFNELFRVSRNQIIWGGQLLSASANAVLCGVGQAPVMGKLFTGRACMDQL